MLNRKPVFWLYCSLLTACGSLSLLAVAALSSVVGLDLLWSLPVAFVAVVLPCALLGARLLSRPAIQLNHNMQRVLTRMSTAEVPLKKAVSARLLSANQAGAEFHDIEARWLDLATTLVDRYARLEAIVRIGQTITHKLDYGEALTQVLSAVAQVVPYDAAEIIRYDRGTLIVAAWRGSEDMLDTTGREYKFGEGLTGTIASTRTTLWKPTLEPGQGVIRRTLRRNKELDAFFERVRESQINSLLGIPLFVKDELIGVLTMVHHEPHHFTRRHKRLLETLASQASVAIHNALAVQKRESALHARIHDLEIRIDEAQKQKEVEAIVGSDYFQGLREQGQFFRRRIRKRAKPVNSPKPEETSSEEPANE